MSQVILGSRRCSGILSYNHGVESPPCLTSTLQHFTPDLVFCLFLTNQIKKWRHSYKDQKHVWSKYLCRIVHFKKQSFPPELQIGEVLQARLKPFVEDDSYFIQTVTINQVCWSECDTEKKNGKRALSVLCNKSNCLRCLFWWLFGPFAGIIVTSEHVFAFPKVLGANRGGNPTGMAFICHFFCLLNHSKHLRAQPTATDTALPHPDNALAYAVCFLEHTHTQTQMNALWEMWGLMSRPRPHCMWSREAGIPPRTLWLVDDCRTYWATADMLLEDLE